MNTKYTIKSPELLRTITSSKKKMQYSFVALIVVTVIGAIVGKEFGNPEVLGYAVALLAIPLWAASMLLVFQLNRRINSLPTAIFRVLISLVPIIALYIIYRTAYEADQFLRTPA
jgi:drug/metabolite transporter (DMT)-like permease